MASVESTGRGSTLSSIFALALINVRRLRFEGTAMLVLGGVIILTSFAVAALPRFLNQVSDDGLRTAVRDAAPINRNISIDRGDRIASSQGGEPFQNVIDGGNELRSDFSPPIEEIIGDQTYVADTVNFEVSSMPGDPVVPFPRFLRIRYQQYAEDHVKILEGRLPEPAGPIQVQLAEDAPPVEVPVHEIAITPETAEQMRIGIGNSILLVPQREDPLNLGIPLNELNYTIAATVSGIIEIEEPDSDYWFGDTRLHEPVVVENPDFVLIYGMGLMSPSDYQNMLDDTRPSLLNYSWRYFVDPDRLDAGQIGTITDELRALEVQFSAGGLSRTNENRLRTGLIRLADAYERQRQLTISMLSLVIAGTLVVAIAVTALLGALIAVRRKEPTLLARSRGASGNQLGWAEAIESLFVFIPAALAGMVLATVFVPGRAGNLVLIVALAVAVAAAIIVLALALPVMRGDLGGLLGGYRTGDDGKRQRLVIEGVVLLAAIAGLILFRRRGLEAGSLSNPDQGFDPFLTSVPILLTIAIGILLLRIYPLPVRLAGWFGSLRRGAVIFVGFRRIIQQPLAARLPLVVMLVATGLAVFSAVVLNSITEGQQASTWQDVGADYRIQSVRENGSVSRFIDLSEINAVEATAEAALLDARNVSTSLPRGNFTLLALDTAEYSAVTDGTRASPEFPESVVIDQNIRGIGTESNPLPAVVSTSWAANQDMSEGGIVQLQTGRTPFWIVVRGVSDRFPSLQPGAQIVIVQRASLDAVDSSLDLRPKYLYVRAPSRAGQEIADTVRTQAGGMNVISRSEEYADIADAPLVDGVEMGFRATVVLATLYAVMAALAGIALTAQERARDLGYLRTLGLTSKQAVVLTAIEQLPPAIISAVVGAGLGFLMVWLVEPGLDLSTFAGTTLPAEVVFDRRIVGLVAGAELATVVIAIAAYSYLTRRMQLGNVLRLGDRI